MLNKEEIEEGKAHLSWLLDNGILTSEDEPYIETVLKYIKQLESDKQKTINKLKEKIRYLEECDEFIAASNDNYSDGTVIKRFIDNFKEILAILKGENDVK